jgi:DNA polymerase-3 subunit delta
MSPKFAPLGLLKKLQEEKKSCILISGEEPVVLKSIRKDILKTCKKDNIDKYIIESKINNKISNTSNTESDEVAELKSKLQNKSLFNERILVEIIFQSGKIKKDLKNFITKNIAEQSENYLIIYFKKPTNEFLKSAWFNELLKYSIAISANEPSEAELSLAIKSRNKYHNVQMDNEAVELLSNLTLGNFLSAENEIEKLALLYDKKIINTPDLIHHISNGSRYDGFQLLEYCINGEIEKTILAANYLEEELTQPLIINGLFSWFFRSISKIKFSKNLTPNYNTFKELRIYGNSQKLAIKATKYLNEKQIEASINKIKDIDLISKGFFVGDPWLELNRFSLGIARIINKKQRKILL